MHMDLNKVILSAPMGIWLIALSSVISNSRLFTIYVSGDRSNYLPTSGLPALPTELELLIQ